MGDIEMMDQVQIGIADAQHSESFARRKTLIITSALLVQLAVKVGPALFLILSILDP